MTSGRHRAVDGLEGVFGENAIVTDTLDLEQATVGRKADLAQFRKILQAFTDGKIVGVVDRGLGTQRTIFFMILLDAGVFVIDVQGGSDVLRDDAGAKPAGRAICDLAVEDQLNFRPRSRFSRITFSKNKRPWAGRSST